MRSLAFAAAGVWVLIGAGLVSAGAEHVYPNYKNAVDDAAHELRYLDKTRYNDALVHARQVWNGIRTTAGNPLIKAPQSGDGPVTLEILDVNWKGVDTLGQWFYNSDRPSKIKLNCWWLGAPGTCTNPGHNLSLANEKIVMAHEVGHTLGLDHMAYNQLMDKSPISSDSVKVNAPQDHDKFHYHDRWD